MTLCAISAAGNVHNASYGRQFPPLIFQVHENARGDGFQTIDYRPDIGIVFNTTLQFLDDNFGKDQGVLAPAPGQIGGLCDQKLPDFGALVHVGPSNTSQMLLVLFDIPPFGRIGRQKAVILADSAKQLFQHLGNGVRRKTRRDLTFPRLKPRA